MTNLGEAPMTSDVTRSAALIRQARSAVRGMDSLLAIAQAGNDETVPEIAGARDAAARLLMQLEGPPHHGHG